MLLNKCWKTFSLPIIFVCGYFNFNSYNCPYSGFVKLKELFSCYCLICIGRWPPGVNKNSTTCTDHIFSNITNSFCSCVYVNTSDHRIILADFEMNSNQNVKDGKKIWRPGYVKFSKVFALWKLGPCLWEYL